MSSKMEITLKSATLPRPRKTSKAEISVTSAKPYKAAQAPFAFKSELEAKIDAFQPQKLRTQRSEVAFPVVAAVPQTNRSSSLEPESRPRSGAPKERIIPIQVSNVATRATSNSSVLDPFDTRFFPMTDGSGSSAVATFVDHASTFQAATDASKIGFAAVGLVVSSIDRRLGYRQRSRIDRRSRADPKEPPRIYHSHRRGRRWIRDPQIR